jgi:hypothetical protein
MMADGGTSNGWGGSKWGTGNWLDMFTSLTNGSSMMSNVPRGIGIFGNSDVSGNTPKNINNPFGGITDSWNSLKRSGEMIASLWNPHLRKKLNEKLNSAKPKTPKELRKITDDDIAKIKNAGEAIALLKEAGIPVNKIPEMNMPKDTDDLGVIRQKVKTIVNTIKPEAPVEAKADANGLVDGKYEKNDVDYLLNQGYTKEDAIALLAKDPKYNKNATDLEKKMRKNSFNLDNIKKKFQDRVKQMFHPETAKDSTTSTTQQTSTKTSVPTQTSTQQKAQQAQTAATATTNVIDYTEKFDTIITLLNIIAGNPLNTSNETNSGNASVHMVNAKNTGNIRADELAKMFTNINNAMNNLASR